MEDDDEDYIFCGTPLPELDDDVVIRKRANQDLTVRDDKGRQRFHGAFTGGFSAGYFNTVGTKEGWEPASFVSSRTNKASSSFQQKTEDFMDEEDFGQFGIAPKRIHTTTNFRDPQTSSVRKRGHVADDVIIPGEPPLKDLIKPVTDSIGIRILKKMGWRHGQGIGPRMKKKSEEVKIIGCSLGPLASEIGDDLVYNQMTFAPDDTPDVPYAPKDDYHGIGYSGLSTQSVLSIPLDDAFSLSKTKSYLAKDKRKLTIRGQAFGVGAFEDDDEDIYTKDDMSQYDFSEFVGNKTDTVGTKSIGAKDTYSSIIEVLEGFTLSTQPPSTKKYFSPPELPAKFKPRHRSRFQTKITTPDNAVVKPKLGHIVRSIMLGEKSGTKLEKSPMPAKPRRSRFDVGPSETQTQDSPYLSISSGRFKPFSRDPEKQNRYEEFIKGGCDKDHLVSMQPPSMTEWERHQEIDEFAKASVLYQPLSRVLDSRFESTSHLGVELTLPLTKIQEKEPEPVVPSKAPKNDQTKRETFEWHPVSLLCKRFNVPNPYPDSKGEGVPNSEKKKKFSLFDNNLFADKDIGNSTSSSSLYNVSVINTTGLHEKSQEIKELTILSSSPDTSHMSESLSENISQPSPIKQEIPKGTKPPMDLFKEIFQSSSSEDSSSDEEKDEKKQESAELQNATPSQKDSEVAQTPSSSLQVSSESKNVSSIAANVDTFGSSRKGFGVFANIDLDALNKRTTTPSSSKPPCAISPENQLKDCSSEEKLKSVEPMQLEEQNLDDVPKPNVENMFYGPEPPPPGFVPPVIKSSNSKAHKHSKHKHKHKEKKKKKHRKKHSRKDSEESSIDSDEDIPTSRILEKLKSLKDLRTPSKKQRK